LLRWFCCRARKRFFFFEKKKQKTFACWGFGAFGPLRRAN
jgi:hypothetical protein